MKTKAFDDILFPANPVGDAPRIINRLRTLFPLAPRGADDRPDGRPRLGHAADHVHPPRGHRPARQRLRLGERRLARSRGSCSSASCRSHRADEGRPRQALIVRLIVDILGFWDWAQKRYGFIARLRDSRIGPVDITGGLGVWGEYGEHPRFLLAAGGFNPRFKDVPAEMSGAVDRLGAALQGRLGVS